MKLKALPILLALAAPCADAAVISLNVHTPGSETVTLVNNGGFELGTGNTTPTNWTRSGSALYDTVAGAGLNTGVGGYSNLPGSGKVAYYKSAVSATNINGQYSQTITLDANTEYVLSAYLWNNSVAQGGTKNLVIDMNDIANEVQFVLAGNATNASAGVFFYQTFNTANTGTSIPLRVFTGPSAYTTADLQIAVWDNIAITRAANFAVPEPSTALLGAIGMLALLRRRRN